MRTANNITRRDFFSHSSAGAGLAGLHLAAGNATASGIEFVGEHPGVSRSQIEERWLPVMTHTHRWRWPDDRPTVPFEDAQHQLADWCVQHGIRAVGVGSPWSPVELASYLRYEGPDRDLYYSGRIDPATVMDTDAVNGTIDQLNKLSGGRTLFFLDNETPKGEGCHVWWFGYHYDRPAWHDYSQDRPVRLFLSDTAETNPLTGRPHTRRTLFEIMAAQHSFGAIGVFAHPTRWWTSGEQFITNIAAFAPLFLAIYGKLDGFTVMGDRPFHEDYQRTWFHFLDSGAVAPGFAETDAALNAVPGPSSRFLNYMPVGPNPSLASIVMSARAGRSFASTGPLLTLEVDGKPMGSIVATSAGRKHRLDVTVYPAPGEEVVGRIEIVGNGGKVIAARDQFRGGRLTYRVAGKSEPGYVVARAFGAKDVPGRDVRQHAVTNPVYLHQSGFRVLPANTSCRIRVQSQSPWAGGELEFQDPQGNKIGRHKVRGGEINDSVPADAQLVLRKNGVHELRFFIALENQTVQRRLRYLMRGDFRRDYPNVQPSQVPVEAFGLAELREAVREFSYVL